MRRFVHIKNADSLPQAASIQYEGVQYTPVFWHTAIDQDQSVGIKSEFTEHMHNFYHIVLYTQGRGGYLKEGEFFPAEPGTCVLIHPGQLHDFVSRRDTVVYSEITFSYENSNKDRLKIPFGELLSLYAGIEINFKNKHMLPTETGHIIQNQFVQLTDYLNSGQDCSEYYIHRTLLYIFDFLIEYFAEINIGNVVDDRFYKIKRIIEERYQEFISMEELANKAGVSKGHFFRTFKKTFGNSPLAYQQKLRIEAAKTLLKVTSLNCNEIAYRIGFEDVYFFHRVFKKHLSMTPGQYRKSQITIAKVQ